VPRFPRVPTTTTACTVWSMRMETDLHPELAEYVLAFSKQMMSRPGLRCDGRPYGEERPCGDERPVVERVAAFLGRELN
jgi:hypothetical protein